MLQTFADEKQRVAYACGLGLLLLAHMQNRKPQMIYSSVDIDIT